MHFSAIPNSPEILLIETASYPSWANSLSAVNKIFSFVVHILNLLSELSFTLYLYNSER